jgi:PAS domain S-box-containing protein
VKSETNKGNSKTQNASRERPQVEVPLAPYWLPAIIESADDAIISKTLDGIITSWNKAAQRIFGYTEDEVLGQPILIIIPNNLRSEETEILSRIRRGERVEHFKTVRQHKNGRLIHISLTISPIKTPDGTIIGASKIARDITDQIEAEEERTRLLKEAEDARHEAEAANRAKDQFLALLSHELRTPLHSMKGWLSMLGNGLLNEEQREKAFEVITRGVDAQNALVEDLLDVSRIVSGKLVIAHDRVSLVSVVSHAVEALRPIAESNGITLDAEIDSEADEVLGDSIRLQQIVSNLLNNAIKYTPDGGHVFLNLERLGDVARITVTDTGVGIPPEMMTLIFERFEQGDSSSRRSFGGLGLGLTIARHLAELHGGKVSGQSEGPGKGSTFVVTIPLMRAYVASYRDTKQPDNGAFRQGLSDRILSETNVLIIEDDIDSLEMLRLSLESSGAAVTSVDRSEKAIDEIGRTKFDLVISDLGLPEMDGYDLIREIRGKLGIASADLPAIALSGYAAEEDRERSLANGFQLHLQKPLDITTLPRTIKDLLERN